jgi:hypothetical protein
MIGLKKAAVFVVLIGATLLFTACPSQTTIRKINANPDRYRGKEVGSRAELRTVTARSASVLTRLTMAPEGFGWLRGVVCRRAVRTWVRKAMCTTGSIFAGRSFGTVLEETDRRSR